MRICQGSSRCPILYTEDTGFLKHGPEDATPHVTGQTDMTARIRKFIGTLVLVPFICLYALAAMVVATRALPDLPAYGQILFYLGAGLLWIVPAGLLIKWMSKPKDRNAGQT